MDFKESIGIFPNALTNEFCDHLIEIFKDEWDNHYIGMVGSGIVVPETKNTRDFDLMSSEKYLEEVKVLTDAANDKIDDYILRYKDVPNLDTPLYLFQNGTFYPNWQLQYYKECEGHFKRYHTEGEYKKFSNRIFAVMFYLNDVEVGGETHFPYWDLKIKPTKGTFVVFPAPWPWMHAGLTPISSDKYIVTTWLVRKEEEESEE
jgi:hypothetical protein